MSDSEIHHRVYPEEKQLLRDQAARYGRSMSEHLRWLVQREERRTLKTSIYPQENVERITKR